jgi:hypothetical protein
MDDAWKTDDSEADIDDIEEPLFVFDSLKKGSLLSEPFDRKNRDPK